MPRIVHFEIAAENPEALAKFYAEVFGWQIQKWAGPMEYWLVTTGPDGQPGINGGLLRRQHQGPTTVNTVEVASVDEYVAKVEQHGGETVMPKQEIPGVGSVAYCADPEGIIFGVFQPVAPAAA